MTDVFDLFCSFCFRRGQMNSWRAVSGCVCCSVRDDEGSGEERRSMSMSLLPAAGGFYTMRSDWRV